MQPIAPAGGWSDPHCPVARAVDLVGDRWSLLILRDAYDGSRSFTEFQRGLGVAKNVLTDRLRRLVEVGVLRRVTAASGKRQEYEVTDAGARLFPVLVALRQWGEHHAFAAGEPHSRLVDESGAAVPPLRPARHDGTGLTAANTHVEKVVQYPCATTFSKSAPDVNRRT